MIVRSLFVLLITSTFLTVVSLLLGQGPVERGPRGDRAGGQPPARSTLRFAEQTTRTQLAANDATGTQQRRRPDKHAPVDPIQANGPIFVDWPKPDVVLLFSGEQQGYLEPCGCAGLHNQKGGLKRRHTLIKQLEARGWPVVAVDLGGQVRRLGSQAQIKFQKTIQSLMTMNYAAVGFGPRDLQMDLLPLVINFDSPDDSPFVSANVAIAGHDSGFTRRLATIEAGGMKIGVTTVLGKSQSQGLQNLQDIQIDDPAQAMPSLVPSLLKEKCDQLILLAHADRKEAEAIAQRYWDYGFNWVVTAGGADEPPNAPESIRNERGQEISYLIEPGHKGMYVVVVGLYRNQDPPFRYQRVPMDHRFEDSPEIQKIFVEYQQELKTLGLDGLGVEPMDHPSGRHFIGSETCGGCHTEAYAVHEGTPHAHATESLLNLDPPRQHDPECLSCHVTGWNPQKYYPYTSGYLNLEETPHLTANGCENCHGPAKRHAQAELGEVDVTDDEREELRAALRLELVENEGNLEGQTFGQVVKMCMDCHDLDNSPDFDFQLYWPEVEHYGME